MGAFFIGFSGQEISSKFPNNTGVYLYTSTILSTV
jgi:amino acid transporter